MNQIILKYLLRIPAVLIALTFHECAHGWVSYKLGDPTAKNLGRLTLNPIKHIDPLGLILMIVVGFGYAKPVPVNSRYYKKPKRDMALVAAAGPLANIIIAFIAMFIYKCLNLIRSDSYALVAALMFFAILAALNVYLAVFNLIPIPPLDGSRLAYIFLPTKWYFGIMKYERYILIGFYVLLFLGMFTGVLSAISNWVLGGMDSLISLIPIFK